MTVSALFDLHLRPEILSEAHTVMREMFVDTRAFPGCVGVRVLVDDRDPAHLLVLETWESMEHDLAYRAFRDGEGARDISSIFAETPVLTRLSEASDI